MGTADVRIDTRLNKHMWSQGIRYAGYTVQSHFDLKLPSRIGLIGETNPHQKSNWICFEMTWTISSVTVFILAHYGPPSTETSTTTIVRCHKNS